MDSQYLNLPTLLYLNKRELNFASAGVEAGHRSPVFPPSVKNPTDAIFKTDSLAEMEGSVPSC